MRTIPNELNKRLNSVAEEKVFREFKQLKWPEPNFVIHSLNLTKTERKRAGEIDFLVVADGCLLVLEVKGGRVSRSEHGTWHFTNRYNEVTEKRESPFEQASGGMYALVKRLAEQGFPEVSRFAHGYGVVFPDIEFQVDSVEWDQQTVLDARAFQTPLTFERSVKRLLKYWREKAPGWVGVQPTDYRELQHHLRPKFELVPTLANRVKDLEDQFSSLTASQYQYIDATSMNKRVLCKGGAGTGKTFMLLETARRCAAAGERTLVTCESAPLARYLSRELAGLSPNVTVTPFAELGSETDRYNTLLVDEGQDILDLDGLAVLDRVVDRGIEKGKWRIFYDPNHQASIHGRFDPAVESMLQEVATLVHLNNNCRNTKDIADQTLLLTGARIGEPVVSRGEKVQLLFHQDQAGELLHLVEVLQRLEKNGVRRGDVTILSMRDPAAGVCSRLPPELSRHVSFFHDPRRRDQSLDQYTSASVADFKGFESNFLIFTDIEGDLETSEVNDLLYVGMTRARVGLFIFLHRDFRPHVRRRALLHDSERT